MKKQIVVLVVSALCGVLLGFFFGPKIFGPVKDMLIACADIRITLTHAVTSLSTFFTGAIRFSVKV